MVYLFFYAKIEGSNEISSDSNFSGSSIVNFPALVERRGINQCSLCDLLSTKKNIPSVFINFQFFFCSNF